MTQSNLDAIILSSIGITKGARQMAQKVYELHDDPNIALISFKRHPIQGYSGAPFLVANVELRKPFESKEEFIDYLASKELSYKDIIVEHEKPLDAGFIVDPNTTDAFYGRFYQPMRFR